MGQLLGILSPGHSLKALQHDREDICGEGLLGDLDGGGDKRQGSCAGSSDALRH